MLMNGKEVNHLVVGGETFDKSYSTGVKAKVVERKGDVWVGSAWIGSIRKDGTVISSLPGGGYTRQAGDIVTVIAIYKNAAAILTDEGQVYNTGSWISLDNLEFVDGKTGGGKISPPIYYSFITRRRWLLHVDEWQRSKSSCYQWRVFHF